MSRRDRHRHVPPSTLDTPERGNDAITAPEEEISMDTRKPADAPDDDLDAELDRRLATARDLKPDQAHWLAEWEAGRDAAIEAIEEGAPPDEVEALAPSDGVSCRDCWIRGRDAVVRALQAA